MNLLLTLILLVQSQVERGVVTGQIRLKDGSTEAGVRVAAMPAPASSTAVPPALSGVAQTDASGHYRLELPPGAYYVTAGPLANPTYYPGVTTAAAAKRIEVKAGATTTAADFGLANPLVMRVSGRIPKPPDAVSATPVQVLLASPPITQQAPETTVAADGTFEFVKIPPGSYMVMTFPSVGLGPTYVNITDHDVTGVNLKFSDASLLGSSFKVEGTTGGPPVQLPPPPLGPREPMVILTGQVSIAQPVPAQPVNLNLTASIRPDGSFEFRNVPPGTYTARSNSVGIGGQGVTIVVADHDLKGVKVPVSATSSFTVQVSGVVSVDDGSALPATTTGLSIQVQRGARPLTTSSRAGTFNVPYDPAQGDHNISVSNLPLGYKVKSITYDGTDLTKAPLKLSGPPTAQINVVLAKLPPESIHGVRVTGKLGPATKYPSGLTIVLTSSGVNGPVIEAPVSTDGTFEFPKVPPGTYSPRTVGVGLGLPLFGGVTPISVGDQDILGLTINVALPAEIRGTARFVDRNGKDLSVVPGGVMVSYSSTGLTRGSGLALPPLGSPPASGRGEILPDGTFRMSPPNGDVRVSADRLPDGYRLKSITAGGVDLMNTPLHVAAEPISGVEVVIEFIGDEH